ncbi:hypothetical protein CK203_007028 [Vitis vinifera]|uniref:PsbP C-terminal domain-containing protein n=1 Tax=Vitis vinifera TaxID=29760 RepID=A0A438KCY8_VITVI|nr:hypothetical protein CK203_007028 [Vitis vinifera]
MAILHLSLSPRPLKPPQNPNPTTPKPRILCNSSKRDFILNTASLCAFSLSAHYPVAIAFADTSPSSKSILSAIANTKTWFQFFGDGFSIRVPPEFEDIMEPEDFNAGLSLYGDKAKPRTFAARSEVLSVVIRPTNQLKITFLEAKDITDLGSLKEAAKIFVPAAATLYSARTIKIKEDDGFRTYYFYEFGRDEQHLAVVAAVNGGKHSSFNLTVDQLYRFPIEYPLLNLPVQDLESQFFHLKTRAFIAGAAAPQFKWDDDGVKLRSAAISLTLL